MWVILLLLALFLAFIVGMAVISQRNEEAKKEAAEREKQEKAKKAVAPVQQTYLDMKGDESCCRLFSQCKSIIEAYAASLKEVRVYCNAVEFFLYPEEEAKRSWESKPSQIHKYWVEISDFLSNSLSSYGRVALSYWIVKEIPIMTYDGTTKDLLSFYFNKFFNHDGSIDIRSYAEILYPKRPSC